MIHFCHLQLYAYCHNFEDDICLFDLTVGHAAKYIEYVTECQSNQTKTHPKTLERNNR